MSAERLLKDAETTLRERAASIEELSPLCRVAIAWLGGHPGPPPELNAIGDRPLRSYEVIAIAAFAEDMGWPVAVDQLDEGLRWLQAVDLDRSGVPAPVTTDAVGLMAVGLATRSRNWLRDWHVRASEYAAQSIEPQWLRGACSLARGAEVEDIAHEVRLALAQKGKAEASEEDEKAVLDTLLVGDLPSAPLHAATLLTALAWIRRAAAVALPGRATVANVTELLRGVQRGLQEWTWEDAPRTRGGEPRKWYVDNEYHVQNLLWAVLSPIFPDLRREEFGPQSGPVQPRVDLAIPSLSLVIEAKFVRQDRALKTVVNEVAEDSSLYFAAGTTYEKMIPFIWDDGARSERHATVVRGLECLPNVEAAIVVSRPGKMTDASSTRGSDAEGRST